jgi:hypothetical protein
MIRAETLQPPAPQPVEGLWRSNLMAIEAVYVKLCGTVGYLLYDVAVPYFVE